MKKGIICIFLCAFICLSMVAWMPEIAYGAESDSKGLYQLKNDGGYSLFTNYVDGYSLHVDQGMKVDMDYSSVVTVLENDSKRIEIYKEILPYDIGQQSYINYSNRFISNTKDHIKEYEAQTAVNGYSVHILQWSREKLSRVENDKNYYVSLDIRNGSREVYSIFVKSDKPLYMTGGYQYLLNNFKTFMPTKAPYTRQAQAVVPEERGWNQETEDFYYQYFGPASTLKWGLFEPAAPGDFTQMRHLEAAMEYEFPILLNYSSFENKYQHPNLDARLSAAYENNKTLELTLQTPPSDSGNMVYDVLNGEYDEFLRDYAKKVSDFDHPVMFRLGNEMNGDWCPYSSYHTSKDTMIFKEFYRYIYKIFEEAGADNVIWIWNPNGKSFPDFKWNDALMYYPGDEYVDIVGLTAYNTGTYYPGEDWIEFDVLYDSLYEEYIRLYQQPMMITEFASSSVGGSKANWIRNMFNHIEKYENIKVAVWWDGCDWDADGNVARPYFIDETKDLLDIFKEYLNKKPKFYDVLG